MAQFENAIIRILNQRGLPAGAGFAIKDQWAITCAHVINLSLGRVEDSDEKPTDNVYLDFPLINSTKQYQAEVVRWDIEKDIAGLHVLGDFPGEILPMRLIQIRNPWGKKIRAFGFPQQYDMGVWADGEVLGKNSLGWLQIEHKDDRGYFVKAGFSGAPVWDADSQGVIGMVIAADRSLATQTAYMLPSLELFKICDFIPEPVSPVIETDNVTIFTDQIQRYAENVLEQVLIYQEDIVRLGGKYTPLNAVELPITVNYLQAPKTVGDKLSVQAVIAENQKLVLVGDSGSGKTTTIVKLVFDSANDIVSGKLSRIPILIFLRDLTPSTSIMDLVRKNLLSSGLDVDTETLEKLIQQRDLLYLLLDGVNELSRNSRENDMVQDVANFIRQASCKVVITTRREGYDPDLFFGIQAVEILPLDEMQIGQILDDHFPAKSKHLLKYLQTAKVQGDSDLPDLAKNPLLLTMLAESYTAGQELATKGQLLERFTKHILYRESQKGSQFSPETRSRLLELVAAKMLERGLQVSVQRKESQAIIKQCLKEMKEDAYIADNILVPDVLLEIDQRILRFLRSPIDKSTVEWEHSVFQEYYAACWLRDLVDGKEVQYIQSLLADKAGLEWYETFQLLARIIQERSATNLILALIGIEVHIALSIYAISNSSVQLQTGNYLISAIAKLLDDKKRTDHEELIRPLRYFGSSAISLLVKELASENYRLRELSANTLNTLIPQNLELDFLKTKELRRVIQAPGFIQEFIDNNFAEDITPPKNILRWFLWVISIVYSGQIDYQSRKYIEMLIERAISGGDDLTRLFAYQIPGHHTSSSYVETLLLQILMTSNNRAATIAGYYFDQLSEYARINALIRAGANPSGYNGKQIALHLVTIDKDISKTVIQKFERNPDDQRGLVAVLGYLGDEAAVNALIGYLRSGNASICIASAVALGETKSPRAVLPLISLWKSNASKETRYEIWESAAMALAKIGAVALPQIIDFITRENVSDALSDLILDVVFSYPQEGRATLGSLLKHANPHIQSGAVLRLTQLKDNTYLPQIRQLRNHPEPTVRGQVLLAEYVLSGKTNIDTVISQLSKRTPEIRKVVLTVLVERFDDERVLSLFAKSLQEDDIYECATRMFPRAGRKGIKILVDQISVSPASPRAYELLLSLHSWNPTDFDKLITDPKPATRLLGIELISGLFYKSIVQRHLEPLLSDGSRKVRIKVIEKLTSLQLLNQLSKKSLQSIARDSKYLSKDFQLFVIAKLIKKNIFGYPGLMGLIRNENIDIQLLAIDKLSKYSLQKTYKYFVKLFDHPSPKVRELVTVKLSETASIDASILQTFFNIAESRQHSNKRTTARNILALNPRALDFLIEVFVTTRSKQKHTLSQELLAKHRRKGIRRLVNLKFSREFAVRIKTRIADFLSANLRETIAAALDLVAEGKAPLDDMAGLLKEFSCNTTYYLVAHWSEKEILKNKADTICSVLDRIASQQQIDLLNENLLWRKSSRARKKIFSILVHINKLNIENLIQNYQKNLLPASYYALEALGWLSDPQFGALIAASLSNLDHEDLRILSCGILANPIYSLDLPRLMPALMDPSVKVRFVALDAMLHSTDDYFKAEALTSALENSNSDVQLYGLGKAWELRSVEALIKEVLSEGTISLLMEFFNKENVDQLKLVQLLAIARSNSLVYNKFAELLLKDDIERILKEMVTAIISSSLPRRLEILGAFIFSDQPITVRKYAAHQIRSAFSEAEVKKLITDLIRPKNSVDTGIFEILLIFGETSLSVIIPNLYDDNVGARIKALVAIETTKSKQSQIFVLDVASKYIEEKSVDALLQLCRTLSTIGDQEALPVLNEILGHYRDFWRPNALKIQGAASAAKFHIEARLRAESRE